jgi:TonB family protein
MRLFYAGACEINASRLLYVVTEYAEENLAQIMPERPLTVTETSEMLGPTIEALSYLHGKGLVHSRIKPSNIMVVDNQLKLSCDSLHAPGRAELAATVYDPPEVGSETISPAADVWSLGVALVETLTQHPPVWDRSRAKEPVLPAIPEPFAGIAAGCLRYDPAHRLTLESIKARLGRTTPHEAVSKSEAVTPAKFPVGKVFAAAVVLIAVIGVVRLVSHPSRPLSVVEKQQLPQAVTTPPQPPSPASTQLPKEAIVKGAVAERLLPDVPSSARKTIQGKVKVRIRITVDPSGEVSNAKFENSGPSQYFANLALKAARQWKFKPAQKDGQTVPSTWILRFQFGQSGTEVIPTEVVP